MEWASIESWIQTAIEFIVSEKKNKDETIEEMRQENDELKLIIDAQQKQIETLTNNQIQLQKDITRVLEKRVD